MAFKKNTDGDLVSFTSEKLPQNAGVEHIYTTRQGGVSTGERASMSFRFAGDTTQNVHENFRICAEQIGGDFEHIVRTQQMHGKNVETVRGGEGFRYISLDNDGLVTNERGTVLCGFYADCQLLFFYDTKNNAIGLAHSGWRGTAMDICGVVIKKMAENYGTNAADLCCTIGPAICQSCFECDSDVPEMLVRQFGEQIMKYAIKKGEKWHMDIGGITKFSLMQHGVAEQNIDVSRECTVCGDVDLFWSHRRQGLARGVHAGMIMLK